MRSIVKFRQVPICDDEKETEGYEVYIEGRLYCCHQDFFYTVWNFHSAKGGRGVISLNNAVIIHGENDEKKDASLLG